MKTDYRNLAFTFLEDAITSLKGTSFSDTRSAALSLRMAIEALTYEKAKLYTDDLPFEEYETWQPKKLMDQLIEIDPHADQNSSLAIGVEPSYGETPKKMQSLGGNYSISHEVIKKYYNALGSYLHVQTIKQMQKGKPPCQKKLQEKCHFIANEIRQCLNSDYWGFNLKIATSTNCKCCGKKLSRRYEKGQKPRETECHNCRARYTIYENTDGQIMWQLRETRIECSTLKCDYSFYMPDHNVALGKNWRCEKCGNSFEIVMAIHKKDGSLPSQG